jgi:hypothetical protein
MKIIASTASLIAILLLPNVSVTDAGVSVTVPISVNLSTDDGPDSAKEARVVTCALASDMAPGTTRDGTPDQITCALNLAGNESTESNDQQVVWVIPI